MALNKKDFEDIKGLAHDTAKALNDVSKAVNESAKSFKDITGDSARTFTEGFKEAQSLNEFLQKASVNYLKDKKKEEEFNKKLEKTKEAQIGLEAKANFAIKKAQVAKEAGRRKESRELFKLAEQYLHGADHLETQVKNATKLKEEFEEINKKTSWIDKMSDLVSEVPVLGKVFGEFKKASIAARDAASESKTQFEAVTDLLGSLSIKGLLAASVVVLTRIDKRAHSLSNSLNISKSAAVDLTLEFKEMAKSNSQLMVDSDDLIESQAKLSTALGISARFSRETLESFDILVDRMGVSEGVASDLAQTIIATGGSFKEFSEDTLGTSQVMNAIEGSAINQKELFTDIAATSNATKLSMMAQGNDMAKVAFQARKLGLTLQQQESIQSNLLDFESSIASELQAELLTGEKLNLERARLAALTGDQATLTAEIAKNIGTAKDFGEKNFIQQEAIAKVFGMQRGDFADMLVKQEALGKMGAKNETEAIKKIKERLAAGESYESIVKDIGSEELANRARNISMQEKMNKLITQVTDELMPVLVPIFQKLLKLMKMGHGWISEIAITLGIIGSLLIGGKLFKGLKFMRGTFKAVSGMLKGIVKGISKMSKSLGGIGGKTAAKGIPQAAMDSGLAPKSTSKIAGKGIGKMVGKGVGKSVLKSIPGLGLLAGLAFGAGRAMDGDFIGAGMEIASGGLSLVDLVAPGVGLASGLAMDAAILKRDLDRAKEGGDSVGDYIMSGGKITSIDSNDTNLGFKPGGPVEKGLSLANTAIVSEIKASNVLLSQILQKVAQPITLEIEGNKFQQSLNVANREL